MEEKELKALKALDNENKETQKVARDFEGKFAKTIEGRVKKIVRQIKAKKVI